MKGRDYVFRRVAPPFRLWLALFNGDRTVFKPWFKRTLLAAALGGILPATALAQFPMYASDPTSTRSARGNPSGATPAQWPADNGMIVQNPAMQGPGMMNMDATGVSMPM